MSRISNRQLVEELQTGNRLGCVHLIDMYQRKLLYECIRVFDIDPRDSEEIVDDVLLSVVQKIETFSFKKSDSDFHFWIMAIFRNKVRDFIRRRVVLFGSSGKDIECFSTNGTGEGDEDAGLMAAAIQEYERSVLEAEGEDDLLAWVAEVLDTMQPWERVLLRCRALEVPYSDIARYTDKTATQLKVYHARVKKRFQRLLAERTSENGMQWHDASKEKTAKTSTVEACPG
ncbi:MAG: sigma-70 family RNA polymerase sigma factor [Bacteroidota bacterium]